MKRLLLVPALVLALAPAIPSAALAGAKTAAETLSVRVGAQTVVMHMPAGFCAPTGDIAAAMQRIADNDKDNVTLLTVVDCKARVANGMPARVIVLKRPGGPTFSSRAQMFQALGTIQDSAWGGIIDSATSKVNTTGGATVDTTLRPAARDDSGFYLAGAMTAGASPAKISLAVGMTVVKGEMVTVNAVTATGGELNDIRDTLALAKAATNDLVASNAP